MFKNAFLAFFLCVSFSWSQTEKYPVFKKCEAEKLDSLQLCFFKNTKELFFKEFKVPSTIEKDNFKGTVTALFVVRNTGEFNFIYANSPYKELKEEIVRVFSTFPKITPASYDNHPIEMRFELPIKFPFSENSDDVILTEDKKEDIKVIVAQNKAADSTFLEVNSQLNVPFTHLRYLELERAMHNAKGTHTASKPYIFSDVAQYYDISKKRKEFLKTDKQTWFGKKLWNEHLLQVKKKDYWFTLDFLFDLQLGKDNSDSQRFTFNNSRILRVNGGLGNKFSFSTTIYESQGRFAEYINQWSANPTALFNTFNLEPVVPSRGKAKPHRDDAFDYPVAEAYLSYTPNKYLQFQFGHGKNFIGDGYRSFLMSDVASPLPYLKFKTNFWKFQYTTIWMWGRDLTKRAGFNLKEYARKYIATHYLSINLSDRFNLGVFETAISTGDNGLDIGFFNPLIFYRSVEFNRGEDAGNALVGLTGKYKFSNNFIGYAQLMIDEFSIGNLGNLDDWRNKFAYQIGAKYFDAFDVENLTLQAEYNYARPYTFAHQTSELNYGHFSQPLAHLWGANFWEAIAIAYYKKDRWSGMAKINIGKKGFDLDDTTSYGGNIYQSYNNRFGDTGNELAQGNTANIFIFDAQANYLLNPANNLNLFAGFSYRNFESQTPTPNFTTGSNIWFTAGIKADLFNWYFDF